MQTQTEKLNSHITQVMLRTMRSSLNPQANLELVHATLGLVSEYFELAKAVSKRNKTNLLEEIGDIIWYTSCGLHALKADYTELDMTRAPIGINTYDPNEVVIGIAIAQHTENIDMMADALKAYLMYNREYKREWWLERFREVLLAVQVIGLMHGITLEQATLKNNAKLRARYPEKFTEEAANNRNTEKELSALNQ
jgi:uncharacterized protein YabN with tetrapyrrole methylase and pyrophosphatase domain